MRSDIHRHQMANRLQTLLLLTTLLGIGALAGWLLFGKEGAWAALLGTAVAMSIQPAANARLTLSLYRARRIEPWQDRHLNDLVNHLAHRAELDNVPELYYIPSSVVNAFSVGSRSESAIAVTDALLRQLNGRELAGVLAHEMAHIRHNDLRVMGLADYLSRLTSFLGLIGQLFLLLWLPWIIVGEVDVPWLGLLILIFSPHLALLAQLGLSRVREYDADLAAVELTGDPEGLASALVKIEQLSGSFKRFLFPGWGHPEPSWLRTHPATESRIRRLLSLQEHENRIEPRWSGGHHHGPAPRPPRWFPGSGHWR